MDRTLGPKAAASLLQAMRPYGVLGTVKGQRLHLASGITACVTTARDTERVNEAFRDVSDEHTALIYSSRMRNDVRVMASIEMFATMVGQLDRLSIEAGRVSE